MREIFTIGHSNHPAGHFLSLLGRHGITALADVRTTPYSRFNPQYRRETLAASLHEAGKAPDLAIRHILADGSIEAHDSVERRLVEQMGEAPPPLMANDPRAWTEAVERAYDERARAWLRKS